MFTDTNKKKDSIITKNDHVGVAENLCNRFYSGILCCLVNISIYCIRNIV